MKDYIRQMRAKIGHDPLIFVGASVCPYRDGKILLQRRRDSGLWADHGGCVEFGERVEDAARRELREETGLRAGALELAGVFSGEETLHVYPNGDQAYIVIVGYLCGDFAGEPHADPKEVLELAWFSLDALPPEEEISPPSRPALAACVARLRERV